jgi:hypothetical protein
LKISAATLVGEERAEQYAKRPIAILHAKNPFSDSMAVYKYPAFLKESNLPEFDAIHRPGERAPLPGIYRCERCGKEIAIAHGHTLSSEHHNQTIANEESRWRLIVRTRGESE